MKHLALLLIILLLTTGCSSIFDVRSDPAQADVYYQVPKTGEKKILGKTPLTMPMSELGKTIANDVQSGGFFVISVEKPGYDPAQFSIPATRFGTMVTNLDVHLKQSETQRAARTAEGILEHLFLAQRLALQQQYERAHVEVDKVLAEFPNFPRALTMRAAIFFAQKNFNESVKWYEEALKIEPKLEDAIRMYAKAKTYQSGRAPSSADKPAAKDGKRP